MQLAMIGLGKMGANMVRRLVNDKHEIVAYDVSSKRPLQMIDSDPRAIVIDNRSSMEHLNISDWFTHVFLPRVLLLKE